MLRRLLDRFRRRNDYVPRHSAVPTYGPPAAPIRESLPSPLHPPGPPPPPPPPPGPAKAPIPSPASGTEPEVQVRVFGRDGSEAALSPDPDVRDRLGYLAQNLLARRPRE